MARFPEDRLTPAVVVALFTVFTWTAAPSVGWLDGGELVASAWDAGLSHPPGQPLPTLLWRAVMLLPLGSIALRATLVSAAALAACAWPLAVLVRHLLPRRRAPAEVLVLPALCLATLTGFAPWTQAVRAEVYAPQLALALGVLAALVHGWSADDGGWRRAALIATALFALSCATHPLLAAGLLPPLLFGVLRRARSLDATTALALAGVLVVGAGFYLYLPLRSLARPDLAWGQPHTLGGFVAVVSGRAFAHNFSPSDEGLLGDNALILARVVARDVGALLAVAAAVAAGWALAAGRRGLLLLAVLAVAGNVGTVLLQNKVFATNPDLHGYLALTTVLIGAAGIAALFAGLRVLWARGRAVLPLVLAAALLGVLGLSALATASRVSLAGNWLPEMAARGRMDPLPPGAVLVTSGNSSAFVAWYLDRVERRRPDLVCLHRTLLGHVHYEQYLRRRHGDPPAGLDTARVRRSASAALAAGRGPVGLEIRAPDLGLAPRLVPAGRIMLLYPRDVALAPALEAHEALRQRWLAPPDDRWMRADPEAAMVEAYERLNLAAYYHQRGEEALVRAELAAIDDVVPGFDEPLPEPVGADAWRER